MVFGFFEEMFLENGVLVVMVVVDEVVGGFVKLVGFDFVEKVVDVF